MTGSVTAVWLGYRSIVGSERQLVISRTADERVHWQRLEVSTVEDAQVGLSKLAKGDPAVDMASLCVVLQEPIDSVPTDDLADNDSVATDALIALVSVLVMRGVTAFETTNPKVVTRILDTHAAISAGEISVLEP